MNNIKKFFAIAASAGLVTTVASSAQAQVQNTPVTVGAGSIASVCSMSVDSAGSIGRDTNGTKIGTAWGTKPEILVICNNAGNAVTITGTVFSLVNPSNTPTPIPNTYTATAGFGTGTGIYATIPNNNISPATFTATGTTAASGDKFRLNTELAAPGNTLLLAGTYTAVINLSLTPQ
jgi:hypothetical protein